MTTADANDQKQVCHVTLFRPLNVFPPQCRHHFTLFRPPPQCLHHVTLFRPLNVFPPQCPHHVTLFRPPPQYLHHVTLFHPLNVFPPQCPHHVTLFRPPPQCLHHFTLFRPPPQCPHHVTLFRPLNVFPPQYLHHAGALPEWRAEEHSHCKHMPGNTVLDCAAPVYMRRITRASDCTHGHSDFCPFTSKGYHVSDWLSVVLWCDDSKPKGPWPELMPVTIHPQRLYF